MQNLEFHLCGINEIDYRNQFDLVFSNSVLHWVIDIEDGLRRLFRALKRNGIIEVQFPILNAEHPLVRYARRAISELGLMKYYDNWSFPWYVPGNREAFIEKLKKAGFINTKASLVKNIFYFSSDRAVYQHFNSVGLDLYTSPLNEKEKEEFYHCIMHDLAEDFPNEASLQYERIYAGAQKPGNM